MEKVRIKHKTVDKDHCSFLREELGRRMGANPLYSQQAFARDLKISPQYLSNILNGRKGISNKTALVIAKKLGLNDFEKEHFCNLVQSRFARSETGKKMAQVKLAAISETESQNAHLTLDSFRVISDWYHFGLIELLKIAGNRKVNPDWFAKRLGIPSTETQMALARLERLELIAKTKTGWKVNQDSIFTTAGVPSDALKKFHKQVLEKAMAAITLQTVDQRYLSSSMMPVREADIPEAKKMIQEFRNHFTNQISNLNGERVYALSMQFFGLTENIEEKI